MLPRLALAGFLLAHAAVHLGYVSRRPPATGGPTWPFELGRSWLLTPLGVDPGLARAVGTALTLATIVAFVVAALAAAGLVAGAWLPAIVAGTAASVVLLIVFFHPWLLLGVAIDVALLWVALGQGWTPAQLPA